MRRPSFLASLAVLFLLGGAFGGWCFLSEMALPSRAEAQVKQECGPGRTCTAKDFVAQPASGGVAVTIPADTVIRFNGSNSSPRISYNSGTATVNHVGNDLFQGAVSMEGDLTFTSTATDAEISNSSPATAVFVNDTDGLCIGNGAGDTCDGLVSTGDLYLSVGRIFSSTAANPIYINAGTGATDILKLRTGASADRWTFAVNGNITPAAQTYSIGDTTNYVGTVVSDTFKVPNGAYFNGPAAAASVTGSQAAMDLFVPAIDANDLVLGVKNSGGTYGFKVDYEGDGTINTVTTAGSPGVTFGTSPAIAIAMPGVATGSLGAATAGGLNYDTSKGCHVSANGSAWNCLARGTTATAVATFTSTCFVAPCVEDTNFAGGFTALAGHTVQKVTCSWGTAGATGAGSNVVTVEVRDETATSTLCTATLGSPACGSTVTSYDGDCNGTMTAGNKYTLRLGGGTLCGTNPGQIVCNVRYVP